MICWAPDILNQQKGRSGMGPPASQVNNLYHSMGDLAMPVTLHRFV